MTVHSKTMLSYETLVHAIAGAVGSVVGMTAFYPLDILRSRVQVEDTQNLKGSSVELLYYLAREEGLHSLYSGIIPVLQSLCASNFVYFYSFHTLRLSRTGKSSPLRDLVFGTIAGCINVITTTPLWVVNTRMRLGRAHYSSLCHGLCAIVNEEGIAALWAGCLPSLLLVSNPALQFMLYEWLKKQFVRRGAFSAFSAFITGALAKAFATVVTYPIQLVQARLRVGADTKHLLTDAKINPKTLFRGLEAKLMQTVLTSALMFVTYEKIARFVFSILRRSQK